MRLHAVLRRRITANRIAESVPLWRFADGENTIRRATAICVTSTPCPQRTRYRSNSYWKKTAVKKLSDGRPIPKAHFPPVVRPARPVSTETERLRFLTVVVRIRDGGWWIARWKRRLDSLIERGFTDRAFFRRRMVVASRRAVTLRA